MLGFYPIPSYFHITCAVIINTVVTRSQPRMAVSVTNSSSPGTTLVEAYGPWLFFSPCSSEVVCISHLLRRPPAQGKLSYQPMRSSQGTRFRANEGAWADVSRAPAVLYTTMGVCSCIRRRRGPGRARILGPGFPWERVSTGLFFSSRLHQTPSFETPSLSRNTLEREGGMRTFLFCFWTGNPTWACADGPPLKWPWSHKTQTHTYIKTVKDRLLLLSFSPDTRR